MKFDTATDEPFPLRRYFWQRIAPGFVLFLIVMVAASVFAVVQVTEQVFLQQAQRRAQTVVNSVARNEAEAWNRLLRHGDTTDDDKRLRAAIETEVRELRIVAMKVYDTAGRVLFSTDPADFQARETNDALRKVVFDDKSSLERIVENGQQLYEIYVPLHDEKGELAAVLELYEPVDYLDSQFVRAGITVAAATAALLLLLLAGLAWMVKRGQREIDKRARALVDVKRKLETFVSQSALDAARGGGDIPSQRVRLTLFYSDARDFTGYSENNPPERVVWFLNELMGIQVAVVRAHGGDVDKMIGDALLARFAGEDAEARALAAALDVQAELTRAALPRPVGIGLYTGDVISGAVGAAERRDFTVIGDGVNVAARLCSAAGGGEIVVDADTLAAARASVGAPADAFGAEEPITVKGRREPVRMHRRPALPI